MSLYVLEQSIKLFYIVKKIFWIFILKIVLAEEISSLLLINFSIKIIYKIEVRFVQKDNLFND